MVLPALTDLLPTPVIHGLRDDVPILRSVLDYQPDEHYVFIEGPGSLKGMAWACLESLWRFTLLS